MYVFSLTNKLIVQYLVPNEQFLTVEFKVNFSFAVSLIIHDWGGTNNHAVILPETEVCFVNTRIFSSEDLPV